jgi:hypothetical protein
MIADQVSGHCVRVGWGWGWVWGAVAAPTWVALPGLSLYSATPTSTPAEHSSWDTTPAAFTATAHTEYVYPATRSRFFNPPWVTLKKDAVPNVVSTTSNPWGSQATARRFTRHTGTWDDVAQFARSNHVTGVASVGSDPSTPSRT